MVWWSRSDARPIDAVRWDEQPDDAVLVYRFPTHGAEIATGARLLVRDGQAAVLVYQNQPVDVFRVGQYDLSPGAVPLLAAATGRRGGGLARAEVWFVSVRRWSGLAWATHPPAVIRDKDLGPVRVRLSGGCDFRVADPAAFLRGLVAPGPGFTGYAVEPHFRTVLTARVAEAVRVGGMTAREVAEDFPGVAGRVGERLAGELRESGVVLLRFGVDAVQLPPDAAERLGVAPSAPGEWVGDDPADAPDPNAATEVMDVPAVPTLADVVSSRTGPSSVRMPLADVPTGRSGTFRPVRPNNGPTSGRILMADDLGPLPDLETGSVLSGPRTGIAAKSAAVPPPLPVQAVYHVGLNGSPAGPFELPFVVGKVRDGEIGPGTLVWRPGMAAWAAAESVPELRPLFAAVPPPLPPG